MYIDGVRLAYALASPANDVSLRDLPQLCDVFYIGDHAAAYAAEIKESLLKNGYRLYFGSPTNQVFFIIENTRMESLGARAVYSFWDKYDDTHTVIRFSTSRAVTKQHVEELEKILNRA